MTVDRDELRIVTLDHPGVGALLLELLVEQRDGDRQPPLQIEEQTGPDAAALMEELDAVTRENTNLRSEVETLRLANTNLHAEVDGMRTAAAAEPRRDRSLLMLEEEIADVKRKLDAERENLTRKVAELTDARGRNAALVRELDDLRRRKGIDPDQQPTEPEPPPPPAGAEPCLVDDCDEYPQTRAAKLCRRHASSANAGQVILIDGQQHAHVKGKIQPIEATHCQVCGSKLSRYREPGDTLCMACWERS